MDNHGTKSNVGTIGAKIKSTLSDFDSDAQSEYRMRFDAIHIALQLQPKDKPAGEQNPSVGQLVADAEKILEFLQGK